MIRTSARTSRKHRRCDCGNPIKPGDRYLEHVASPGHTDLFNPGWIRMAECELCATGYGRQGHFAKEAHAGRVHDLYAARSDQ